MTKYFLAVFNALFEKQPHELVGTVLISLIVSLVLAGLYKLARRKTSETLVLSTIFLFVACMGSMVLTLGYTSQKTELLKKPGPGPVVGSGIARSPRNTSPGIPNFQAANAFFLAADLDGDGALSPEEAAQFVKSVNTDDKGSVNTGELSKAVWERVGSRRGLLGASSRPEMP